eukprot:1088497-Rhodomonas_salina.1
MARLCIALRIEMVHSVERETASRSWDAKQLLSLNEVMLNNLNACDTQQCSTLLNNTGQHSTMLSDT